ncbi:MAG: molybdopterin molybdotransferase MoeA, partial [Alphaproteobacteria bacterium]
MKNVLVDEARATMLALVKPLRAETVELEDAAGRTLSEPVTATRDQPPFTASAMDGWAVRSDEASAGARLNIAGESAAGHGFAGGLHTGEAVRIFTGAPVPVGADTVLIQEDATREGDVLIVGAGPARGANMRAQGGDFCEGDVLIEAGARLDAWRLSLAAAAGRGNLSVARRPKVAILSTGDEIVLPGTEPGPHQ